MAKSLLKIQARELRRRGESIRDIALKLGIAKSSVSLWCLDITLSSEQIKKLLESKKQKIRLGQINGALSNKNRRLAKIAEYEKRGMDRFKNITDKEFFVAGLSLYLAEGSKKERRTSLINSDPDLLKFMILWFKKDFGIRINDIVCSVLINEIHKKREEEVKTYWSKHLNIPVSQFRKTTLVKSKQRKIYENYNNHFGTLRIKILKSSDLSYRIMGLIKGLLRAGISLPA